MVGNEILLRFLNVGDAILDRRGLQRPELKRKMMHKSEAREDFAVATKAHWQEKNTPFSTNHLPLAYTRTKYAER